eukprot:SAG31_NODE_853_length_11512_cov_42.663279_5_plen_121_part_00
MTQILDTVKSYVIQVLVMMAVAIVPGNEVRINKTISQLHSYMLRVLQSKAVIAGQVPAGMQEMMDASSTENGERLFNECTDLSSLSSDTAVDWSLCYRSHSKTMELHADSETVQLVCKVC